jgi:transcriptional regulator with XRE-family HTH domain
MSYENNQTEPLLKDLKKIAQILEIEVDKLFDDYYRFLDYPYNEKIKELRKRQKLPQCELGAILGVGRRAVENWERGNTVTKRKTWERLRKLNLL